MSGRRGHDLQGGAATHTNAAHVPQSSRPHTLQTAGQDNPPRHRGEDSGDSRAERLSEHQAPMPEARPQSHEVSCTSCYWEQASPTTMSLLSPASACNMVSPPVCLQAPLQSWQQEVRGSTRFERDPSQVLPGPVGTHCPHSSPEQTSHCATHAGLQCCQSGSLGRHPAPAICSSPGTGV
jgi:hypothetical protein